MGITTPFVPPVGNFGAILATYVNAVEQGQEFAFNEYFDDNFYGTNMPWGWEKFIALGYLQSLWMNLVSPPSSEINNGSLFGLSGSGRVKFGTDPTQFWCIQAVYIHFTQIPVNTDSLFGVPNNSADLPWQILGRCGFMVSGYYGETKFLNHQQCVIKPDDRNNDGWWFILPPGAQMNIYVEALGSYEGDVTWVTADGSVQQPPFNVDNINLVEAPELTLLSSPPSLYPYAI
jgi:hypothetical protein